MVHLDKTEGQKGSLVLTEDGSIISSSGDLASSEATAQTIMALLSQSLKVDFNENNTANGQNGIVNQAMDNNAENANLCTKWNRVTVNFGDHSYVACLSNKKIHVVKRDSNTTSTSQHQHQDNIDH